MNFQVRRNDVRNFWSEALVVWLIFVAMAFMSQEAKAGAIGRFSLPYVMPNSNLIVKGSVLWVTENLDGDDILHAEIKIDSVLKGKWETGNLFLQFPAQSKANLIGRIVDTLAKDEYALFFLKTDGGIVRPVDEQHIKLPIRPGRVPMPDEPNETESLIRDELLFTAFGPSTLYSKEDEAKKERAKQRSVWAPFGIYSMKIEAVRQLGYLPAAPQTLTLLESLASSPNSDEQAIAIASLLNLNQASVLPMAVNYLKSESPKELFQPYTIGHPKDWVTRAIRSIKSVEAIEPLSELLNYPESRVRESAICALRQIGQIIKEPGRPLKDLREGKTIPFLVRALDDSSPEVRLQAIWALSEITSKNHWFPNYRYQDKDFNPDAEKKIIDQWKEWWRVEGRVLFYSPV